MLRTSQISLTGGQDLLVVADPSRIFLQLYVDTSFAYLGDSSVTASVGCRIDPGIFYYYKRPEAGAEFYAYGTSGKVHVLEILEDI